MTEERWVLNHKWYQGNPAKPISGCPEEHARLKEALEAYQDMLNFYSRIHCHILDATITSPNGVTRTVEEVNRDD